MGVVWMKRQGIRRTAIMISFLLFPVTMNFLSPYVIIAGANEGIINGSFIFFIILFTGSLFLGRVYCGWVCPAAFLQESCFGINDKKVKGGKSNMIKFFIWFPWLAGIAVAAIHAGGYKSMDLLYLTETGISVDSPEKYIMYYGVILIFVIFALIFGRRSMCHYICWMAPFMIAGKKVRRLLKLPSMQLDANSGKCIDCKSCVRKCPMSLDVNAMVKKGNMENSECVLCGECVDTCPKKAIKYSFGRPLNL